MISEVFNTNYLLLT